MNRTFAFISTAVLSAAAGGAAGFFISKKILTEILEAQYEERLVAEIAQTKAFFNEQTKAQRTPGEALATLTNGALVEVDLKDVSSNFDNGDETLERIVKGLRYGSPALAKPAIRTVFMDRSNDADEDFTEEDETRDPSKPYIISVDEYMAGEKDYSQITLTYFVEDDTLIDEGDVPIENVDMVVGELNLDKFGYRSKDPKIVYVRNEKLGADYEILRHEGSFGEVVHGQIAPKISKVPRRMRPE